MSEGIVALRSKSLELLLSRVPKRLRSKLIDHDLSYFQQLADDLYSNQLLEDLVFFPLESSSRCYGAWQRTRLNPFSHFIRRGHRESQHYGHDIILSRSLSPEIAEALVDDCIIDHGIRVGLYYSSERGPSLSDPYAQLPKNRWLIRVGSPNFINTEHPKILSVDPLIRYSKSPIGFDRMSEFKKFYPPIVMYFPHITRFDNIRLAEVEQQRQTDIFQAVKDEYKGCQIIVCLHWYDLVYCADRLPEYSDDSGSVVACCGDISNPYFLDHLRFLFDIAEYVVTSEVSTNLIYSCFLSKPTFLVSSGFDVRDVYADTVWSEYLKKFPDNEKYMVKPIPSEMLKFIQDNYFNS